MAMIRGLSLNKEKSSKEQEIIVGNVASGWVPVRNPKSKVYIFLRFALKFSDIDGLFQNFVFLPQFAISKSDLYFQKSALLKCDPIVYYVK